MKESDDLVEMVLKKSQNGMEGFEPHPIIMEATVNTGFALTVGYSMKQGTQELHGTVAELQTVLNELVSLCTFYMLMLRFLQQSTVASNIRLILLHLTLCAN